jgi:hypothetical protein
VTFSSGMLSILIGSRSILICLVEILIKHDLGALKVTLHICDQCNVLDKDEFRIVVASVWVPGEIFFLYITSSANLPDGHAEFCVMSLTNKRNNKGPKIYPWGTPACRYLVSDVWPPTTTLWHLNDK